MREKTLELSPVRAKAARASVLSLWLVLLLSAPVQAVDLDRFLALDRDALRSAEARLPELLDAETGELLSEPTNEAERYVVDRQMFWRARSSSNPVEKRMPSGAILVEHPPGSQSVTWLGQDAFGRPVFMCGGRDQAPGWIRDIRHDVRAGGLLH